MILSDLVLDLHTHRYPTHWIVTPAVVRVFRTFDPDLADYFYVPVYYTCMMYPIYSAADHPWFAPGPLSESRPDDTYVALN